MRCFFVAAAVWLMIGTRAHADGAAPASATFADILLRVAKRDPGSDAIFEVQPKADAPRWGERRLRFSMVDDGGDARIQLYMDGMRWDVFESYKLKWDPSMRLEMDKLKLRDQQTAAREATLQKERAARIQELSGGRLHYGMKREEVIAAWGAPKESLGFQAGSALVYEGYLLSFTAITLEDMVKTK